MILQLESITAGYGETVILRDIDLEVAENEVVALIGPNGAGKTTLLNTASGFVKPLGGTLRFDGDDVTGGPPHQLVRRGLCQVPEGRGVFPSLTVEENLTVMARSRDVGDAVDVVTDLFPVLGARLSQTAGSLSGGEQQMLALSRAYLADPKLILVDELSLGLAPLVVDKIYDVLRRLLANGTSCIIVEQYIQRVLELATTVYILNQGEIVHRGPASETDPDEIYRTYLGVEASGISP